MPKNQSVAGKAAINIQKHFRGFLTRKKYAIQHLPKSKQAYYPTFAVGNDPCMPKTLNTYCEHNEKIALIATSGLRAVLLACKLGSREHTPKIIIIDNSNEVYRFWYAFRQFMQNSHLTNTPDLFFKNLPDFLKDNETVYRNLPDGVIAELGAPGIVYPSQNMHDYFNRLITKYGYDYVRAIVSHASLITQTWSDPNVFIKVKNILAHQGINKIYMYPSNIIACEFTISTQNQILQNIQNIKPVLSIHTDRCDRHHLPENVYIIENQDPAHVKNLIFSSSTCLPQNNHPEAMLMELDLDQYHQLVKILNTIASRRFKCEAQHLIK